MSTYSEKLKNPQWQKKRLKILERDNFECQRCGDGENTLAVHHKKYIPGKDPWDYNDNLLITLCEDCHEHERKVMPEYERQICSALKKKFLAEDINSIMNGFIHLTTRHPSDVTASIIEFTLQDQDAMDIVSGKYFKALRISHE